jgi:hypothetical protein
MSGHARNMALPQSLWTGIPPPAARVHIVPNLGYGNLRDWNDNVSGFC